MQEIETIYLGGTPRVSMAGQYTYTLDPGRSLSFERKTCTKFGITLAILFSLALKIVSLIVLFARMEVSLIVIDGKTGRETKLLSDFISDFSFPQMIRDFYDANAYLMCALIVLGSAAVPIAKHLFMLLVWWVPISARYSAWRRTLLFIFDQTGKTALVDLFLIGYVICIFYTNVSLRLLGMEVQMLLQAEPVRGIFLAMASMFIGNFLSHYLLLVHDEHARGGGGFDRQVTVAVGPASTSLSKRLYISLGNRSHAWWHLAVPLIIAIGIVSLAMATQVELISFHLSGLAGKIAQQETRRFTLLTAPNEMQASSQNYYGTLVLSVMHVTLVIIIPFCLLSASIVLWFVPIHLRPQRRLLSYFPFWFSWCTLDVCLMTSVAAYLEMHLIAEFTFDHKFALLCSEVEKLTGLPCVDLEHGFNWFGMTFAVSVCIVLGVLTLMIASVGRNLIETDVGEAEDALVVVMDNPLLLRSPDSASSPGWGVINGNNAE